MSDKVISISVPEELSFVSDLAQGIVDDVLANKNWIAIAGAAVPKLFQEGINLSALKAEVKDPKVWTLGALLIGTIVTKVLADKAAAKLAVAGEAAAHDAPAAQ